MNPTLSPEALFNPGRAEDFFQVEALGAFDPLAAGFHRDNALWLMECSRLIYLDETLARQTHFRERAGLEEVKFFQAKATEGAFLRGEGFGVLVFRGTLGVGDMLADVDFVPVSWPGGGTVHRGFRDQLEEVWAEVGALLERARVPVFFTGHSLGGALATLAAARCHAEGRALPAAVYSFGSPRVGTDGFVQAFPTGTPHFRVVNAWDVVPTLPWPSLPSLRFHHVGLPCVLGEDGEIRFGNSDEDAFADAAPFAAALLGLSAWRQRVAALIQTRGARLGAELTDHTPVNYTAKLERLPK